MALNARNLAYGGGPQSSGRIRISIAPWVTAGGAAAYVEVGHTDGSEHSSGIETIEFESDQSSGPLEKPIVKVNHGFKVSAMETRLDLMRIAFAQPAASLVGSTLYLGDPTNDDKFTIKAEVKGPSGASTPNRILTLWRCQMGQLDPLTFGKRVLQKLVMTFSALRDDSIVANPGVYGQYADAA